MVTLISTVCAVFYRHGSSGERNAYEKQSETLRLIEPTIRRALDYAIVAERWSDARNLTAALRLVLTQQGRLPEWRRLAADLQVLVLEDAQGKAPDSRNSLWYLMHQDRIEDLMRNYSLTEAQWLQDRMLQQVRAEHAAIEGKDADQFAQEVLIPELRRMGDIHKQHHHQDTVHYYLEALQIAQKVQSEIGEQRIAMQLADFYLTLNPLDGKELSYWLTYASDLCRPHDRLGRAKLETLRGYFAITDSRPAEAIEHFQFVLKGLLADDPSDERAECELKLGQALFEHRSDLSEAMQYVQSAIAWFDKTLYYFQASSARLAVSHLLFRSGERDRALYYAKGAARGFSSLAPNAEKEALKASRFVAVLEDRKLKQGD